MPPEAPLAGPERAGPADVEGINRLFAEAFTDRYHRDGLRDVRVPRLNPAVWRFAIADAAEGALVWRDPAGQVAAFNMVHRSGCEGWMGPLAVRPDRQGEGQGTAVVRAGIAWLETGGAATIGLETMPRTVENIGFYSRLGFVPGHLTVSLTRDLAAGRGRAGPRLSGIARGLAGCRDLTAALRPGLDFSRELVLTLELGLGDATVVSRDGAVAGFALWHSAPLAEGRPPDELRVLKLAARDDAAFDALLAALEEDALAERLRRVVVRCQTAYTGAYRRLLARGYLVHWTDLRMTLASHPEAGGPGVVFSNWEI